MQKFYIYAKNFLLQSTEATHLKKTLVEVENKRKKGIVQSFPEFALCGYQKGGKMRIGIEMIV